MDSGSGDRQRFYVKLKPGETTIVSWKKLLRDSIKRKTPLNSSECLNDSKSNGTVESSAVIEQIDHGVEVGNLNESASNGTTETAAVFERSDRLYAEKYFNVDNSKTRDNDYTRNNGQLKHMSEPNLLASQQPKRRGKSMSESARAKHYNHNSFKRTKLNHVSVKDAAGAARVVQKSCAELDTSTADHERVGKSYDRPDTTVGSSGKKLDNHDVAKQKMSTKCLKDPRFLNDINVSSSLKHEIDWGKNMLERVGSPSNTSLTETTVLEPSADVVCEEENGNIGLPDLNYPAEPLEISLKHVNDVSADGQKDTMLERAIKDLEMFVIQSRPPKMEVHNVDTSSFSTKRRLPREVKEKLAKVARLAQSSEGKITDELLARLMSFLGHIVQRRTLKRNLREMVSPALSEKQENADRLQKIKNEVVEMINLQISQQDLASFSLSESRHIEGDSMNYALEEKLCGLYELYVQGIDEDKGPQIQKLYIELAELWPNGLMDKHGIEKAISRAKERRRVLHDCSLVQDQISETER